MDKKIQAIKHGRLVASVARDTRWSRNKVAYAPAPKGVSVLTEAATITVAEGRERCGYGPMELAGCDMVRACRDGDYRRGTLVPTVRGQWANYGAPHGTHTEFTISWVFIVDAQATEA